jgi:polyisoprenoid-binding protein YceI
MNTKAVVGIIILAVVIIVGWKIASTKAPESIPEAIVTENTGKTAFTNSFNFTGYGVGKEHKGTFKDITYVLTSNQESVIGTITIKNASIDTGIAGLDKHLCSPDFIDCVKYPETVFTLSSVEKGTDGNLTAKGALTFKGETKELSFPVTLKNGIYTADFRLKTSFFGFSNPTVKEEIRIEFAVKA